MTLELVAVPATFIGTTLLDPTEVVTVALTAGAVVELAVKVGADIPCVLVTSSIDWGGGYAGTEFLDYGPCLLLFPRLPVDQL